jgi:hypothetical protein
MKHAVDVSLPRAAINSAWAATVPLRKKLVNSDGRLVKNSYNFWDCHDHKSLASMHIAR